MLRDDTGANVQGRCGRGGAAIRLMWLGLGWVSLGFGAAGIVLPVLPTTPFVILAALCFAKGSSVMADRLNRSRLFGPILGDWRTSGAIAHATKRLPL
ncbi:YbaN family protein [Pseudorhodobacter antarcticus]|uniref:YbaN family protein n=1 Tax=Pseudorhodobacter antarcticus TaxID=1077947 RepID=UPI000A64F6FF|nr:YbaN family protein [Pseudorhodobacter antarcticus]